MKSGRSANGKGHYWAIHPANLEDFIKGDFRRRKAQRKVRRHMGLSVPDDDEDEDDEESPLNSPNAMMAGHHPLGLPPSPLLPGGASLPDPATALLLASNPQLLSMSGPLFGQLNLFNSLRQHLPPNTLPPLPQPTAQLPQPPQLPLPPPPPISHPLSLTNPLFNEHIYKQLISLNFNINLKQQSLALEAQSRHKLDSPPLQSTKKEFSIESLLRPSAEQSSRTPSPSARKTPTSDYEADITPVNLKIFP